VSEDSTETVDTSEAPSAAPKPAAPAAGKSRASTKTAEHGFFARTAQFLRDTRAEMRRVSWPTAVMVKNTTIITLVAVVFFSLYLFAVDRVWAFLIEHLRGWLGG
jgi:preprotein translocase subunit SecE